MRRCGLLRLLRWLALLQIRRLFPMLPLIRSLRAGSRTLCAIHLERAAQTSWSRRLLSMWPCFFMGKDPMHCARRGTRRFARIARPPKFPIAQRDLGSRSSCLVHCIGCCLLRPAAHGHCRLPGEGRVAPAQCGSRARIALMRDPSTQDASLQDASRQDASLQDKSTPFRRGRSLGNLTP